jgi:integrase
MPLSSISSRSISAWLDELETPEGVAASGRTRNNYRASIIQLFSFSRSQKYLPRDLQTEAEQTPKAKAALGEVGVLSPADLAKLFSAAEQAGNEEAILWLALGAFSGLRSAELVRLRWDDIDLENHEIDARHDMTKTAAARYISISDNLHAWLAPFSAKKGSVFAGRRALDRTTTFAEAKGVIWPSNCLRHSFGTYRLARGIAIHEVAREMGNSPRMIETHYRAKAKRVRQDAQAWFAIGPGKG